VGIPLLLAAVVLFGSFGASHGQPERRAPDALMVILVLIGPIALCWMRRQPVAVLWATALSTLAYMLLLRFPVTHDRANSRSGGYGWLGKGIWQYRAVDPAGWAISNFESPEPRPPVSRPRLLSLPLT
jgi:hypothetical protein